MASGFIPTKSSVLKPGVAETYEHVTFIQRKSKRSHKSHQLPSGDSESTGEKRKASDGSDMKKLRYEVIKFGTAGLNSKAKEESSVALAVALGAKPPKRPYKNYKEILASKLSENTESSHSSKKTKSELISRQPNQHFYVVGQKAIPARPTLKDGKCKKLLDVYGRVDRKQLRNNDRGWKKGRRS